MAGKILGGLFWGMIADKWKCHRLLSILTCLVSIACAIGQLGASMALASEEANRCRYDNLQEKQSMIPLNLKSNLTSQHGTTNNTLSGQPLLPENSEPFGILFLTLLMLSMMNLFTDCSLELLDTGVIRKVQITSSSSTMTMTKERRVNYGAQRAFAPVGGTIGNILTNLSIQYFPRSTMSCFTGMFGCYTLFMLLTLVSTILIYRGLSFTSNKDEIGDDEKGDKLVKENLIRSEIANGDDNTMNDKEHINWNPKRCINAQKLVDTENNNGNDFKRTFLKTIFRSDILFLLVSTVISGMFYSPMLTFHYLFLKDLNATAIMYSLITAAGSVGGILGYRFSNKLVKLMTPFRALVVCYACIALVQLCFSMAEAPWLLVLPRPLFGFAFCFSITSGMTYLKDNCPVDVLTSIISLYVALFYGVGPGIGLAISGEVYGAYGGNTLFGSLAIFSLSWSFIVGLYYYFHHYKTGKC